MGWVMTIDGVKYFENFQCASWSSGPMYFTNVGLMKNGKVIGTMFNWILDESVKNGVYYDNGRYYV